MSRTTILVPPDGDDGMPPLTTESQSQYTGSPLIGTGRRSGPIAEDGGSAVGPDSVPMVTSGSGGSLDGTRDPDRTSDLANSSSGSHHAGALRTTGTVR